MSVSILVQAFWKGTNEFLQSYISCQCTMRSFYQRQKWHNDALVRNGTQQELIASQKSLMFNALKLPFHFYDQIKTLFHKFHIFATARGFQSTPLHLERSGLKTRGLISREAWCKATPMNHDINHDIMIHFFVYCWLV